ncbi:MAG: beta-galactosidase [Candidatus Eremiobacteraeota bacterium]|nr:beta-galactosidase [Candidatus Eremiobacteraeota bacterium]
MFRRSAGLLVFALAFGFVTTGAAAGAARAPSYGHSAIAIRSGEPVFEVDGAPFFLYGAAFFYERLPRDLWASSLDRMRALGINTLDLYVPWNWHELDDGDFDFDGRTNPRRDLAEVLRLARRFDFRIILRPGPVIRNEWRNGGYPAWLLQRPEYGMPQHDLLEGRYPPTATLQNAHSDDAAAQWMRNATHMAYARRWLERVLRECEPVADRIVAVALDDDQGAYLDNQTYPAPHLAAYLRFLEGVVRSVTGPREPVFINTYQMKVPASSPVWAMGNWYQSDVYALGGHDRAQLEFSTGLLHTRPAQPLMASEFQAGWLQGPGDARPRAADPSNTQLALATMLGMGVRGVVHFPAQDTLYPGGWEAPFANAFYAWDAALRLDGAPTARAAPVAQIGALVKLLGPQFAGAAVKHDAAIAYLGGSYPAQRTTNLLFGEIAAQTMRAQTACRDAGLSCALVDPAALRAAELLRYPVLIVPDVRGAPPLTPAVARAFASYRRGGGRLVAGVPAAHALLAVLHGAGQRAVVEGVSGASFAPDRSGTLRGFLTVANYRTTELDVRHASVALARGVRLALPPFAVAPHSALVTVVGLRLAKLDRRFRPGDVVTFSDCMPVGVSLHDGTLLWRNAMPFAGVRLASATRACRVHARIGGKPYVYVAGTDAAATVRIDARGAASVDDVAIDASRAQAIAPAELGSFVPIGRDARLPAPEFLLVPGGRALAYRSDVYRDGQACVVLDNGIVRVVVSPAAGARAFVFEDLATGRNVFTTVGALRDDVALEPPLSQTDRIAKYTHDFPAGMFNRPYDAQIAASGPRAGVRFRYAAPDVVPYGAVFSRSVALDPLARAFDVEESVDFPGAAGSLQRAVSVTSLSVGDSGATRATMSTQHVLAPQATSLDSGTSLHVASGHALGYYDGATHELATIAWRAGDVEDALISERGASLVVRLTLAPGRAAHVRYGFEFAPSLDAARGVLEGADAAAQRAPQGA